MFNQKGFSLTELTVVLIILGLLAAIAIPSYQSITQQAAAIAAQNNLVTIYNAEKNYYFNNNGQYCIVSVSTPTCADTLTDINASMSLDITDNNFSYACSTDATGFSCLATNNSDGTFKLSVTNSPIVLPIETGALNPTCTYPTHQTYCPN